MRFETFRTKRENSGAPTPKPPNPKTPKPQNPITPSIQCYGERHVHEQGQDGERVSETAAPGSPQDALDGAPGCAHESAKRVHGGDRVGRHHVCHSSPGLSRHIQRSAALCGRALSGQELLLDLSHGRLWRFEDAHVARGRVQEERQEGRHGKGLRPVQDARRPAAGRDRESDREGAARPGTSRHTRRRGRSSLALQGAIPAGARYGSGSGIPPSLDPQGGRGVDARGAARRHPARQERDGSEEGRRCQECRHIGRLDAEQAALERARQP